MSIRAAYEVTDPMTGRRVGQRYPYLTDAELTEELNLVGRGYLQWKRTPLTERVAIVNRIADLFERDKNILAETMEAEIGKRPPEAVGELDLVVDILRYYAREAATLLGDTPIPTDKTVAVLRKDPIGAVFGIMPWNYPYYQVARFIAPNLVAGNAIVLKHAPNCPLTALAITRIVREAGLPDAVYRNIFIELRQVEQVIASPVIQGVSLTGSAAAGRSVAALAGKYLKKVVLELGGSDPLIILDSADLRALAKKVVQARLSNCGQACNAPKRVIVLADLYQGFENAVMDELREQCVGDPKAAMTTVGPLASRAAAEHVVSQIKAAVTQGGKLRYGGRLMDGQSALMEPALLTNIPLNAPINQEEIFGPVIVLYKARDVEEAIQIANDTPYGLGASIYSDNREDAVAVSDKIDSGMVYINETGGSRPELPFGGIKGSGIGRELGTLGIEEFINKKVITIS